MNQFNIIFLICCIFIVSCTQEDESTIIIEDAWIREAPPHSTALAAYLTINNNTKQDCILKFAKSEQFRAIEIHRTSFVGGVAKMRRYKEVPIPAADSLVFKPGDFHLMLFGPNLELKSDDEVIVTLGIIKNSEIEEFEVKMQVKNP